MELDAEVGVVGLGAMGSAALWRLAVRGVDVIGFEQFQIGHDQGSSHGESRLFRTLCLEHPSLVTVARTSRELLRELEGSSGEELLRLSGGLMIGAPDSDVIAGVLDAAQEHDVRIDRLSAREVMDRFPAHHNLQPNDIGLWDAEAGVVRPEASIIAACQAARGAGSQIIDRTAVIDIAFHDDAVHILTSARTFRVGRVIVATGAWLKKLVPSLSLSPLRVPMTWFDPIGAADEFDLTAFPVFIRAVDHERRLWGHGAVFGHTVKIGDEDDPNFRDVDADHVDRGVGVNDWFYVSRMIEDFLPGLSPTPSQTMTCMITRSPDMQFQLGPIAAEPRLIVAGGDSGHAFKHATGIGEYLAQLTIGEEPFVSLDFTNPNRFAIA